MAGCVAEEAATASSNCCTTGSICDQCQSYIRADKLHAELKQTQLSRARTLNARIAHLPSPMYVATVAARGRFAESLLAAVALMSSCS